MQNQLSERFFNPIWHGEWGTFWFPYQLYYNKRTFNRFSWLSFIFIVIKFIITRSGQIWIHFLETLMSYDLFVEERYNISRISGHIKKIIYLHFLRHRYIPHINNLLLISDLLVKPIMTCKWRHYWLQNVLMTSSWTK